MADICDAVPYADNDKPQADERKAPGEEQLHLPIVRRCCIWRWFQGACPPWIVLTAVIGGQSGTEQPRTSGRTCAPPEGAHSGRYAIIRDLSID